MSHTTLPGATATVYGALKYAGLSELAAEVTATRMSPAPWDTVSMGRVRIDFRPAPEEAAYDRLLGLLSGTDGLQRTAGSPSSLDTHWRLEAEPVPAEPVVVEYLVRVTVDPGKWSAQNGVDGSSEVLADVTGYVRSHLDEYVHTAPPMIHDVGGSVALLDVSQALAGPAGSGDLECAASALYGAYCARRNVPPESWSLLSDDIKAHLRREASAALSAYGVDVDPRASQ